MSRLVILLFVVLVLDFGVTQVSKSGPNKESFQNPGSNETRDELKGNETNDQSLENKGFSNKPDYSWTGKPNDGKEIDNKFTQKMGIEKSEQKPTGSDSRPDFGVSQVSKNGPNKESFQNPGSNETKNALKGNETKGQPWENKGFSNKPEYVWTGKPNNGKENDNKYTQKMGIEKSEQKPTGSDSRPDFGVSQVSKSGPNKESFQNPGSNETKNALKGNETKGQPWENKGFSNKPEYVWTGKPNNGKENDNKFTQKMGSEKSEQKPTGSDSRPDFGVSQVFKSGLNKESFQSNHPVSNEIRYDMKGTREKASHDITKDSQANLITRGQVSQTTERNTTTSSLKRWEVKNPNKNQQDLTVAQNLLIRSRLSVLSKVNQNLAESIEIFLYPT